MVGGWTSFTLLLGAMCFWVLFTINYNSSVFETFYGESYSSLQSSPVIHWNQSIVVGATTSVIPEKQTIKPSVFPEVSTPKVLNASYHNEIPTPSSLHSESHFNNQSYPRSPVNKQRRTTGNDVFQRFKNFRSSQRFLPKENTFDQDYRLEFYEGSRYVGTEGFTDPIRNVTDFTIISQTTKQRLFFFPMLLNRWKGDFCITVFLEESDAPAIKTMFTSMNYPSRLHLILYIVNREKKYDCVYRSQHGSLVCEKELVYPLNRLRNIAIQNIRTSHFIVFDMDMWPAKSLYDTLLNLPPEYLRSDFVVTIIPAFSLPDSVIKSRKCKDLQSCITLAQKSYPETRDVLVKCLNAKKCTVFRPKSNTHDYLPNNWKSLPPSVPFTKVDCFRQSFLEPYVMVKKTNDLPMFDERFINYGFNKVEWIENLRYRGYEFHVLSQSYAVDMPHSLSDYAKTYNKGFADKTMPMLVLYKNFLMEMRNNYKDESRQVLCLSSNKSKGK